MIAALRHVDKAARHARIPDDRLVPAGATLVAVAMAGLDARGGDRRKAKCAPRGLRGRIVHHFRRRLLALLVRRLQRRARWLYRYRYSTGTVLVVATNVVFIDFLPGYDRKAMLRGTCDSPRARGRHLLSSLVQTKLKPYFCGTVRYL